jgi:YidC/Oxa1 family membrane protein insertase
MIDRKMILYVLIGVLAFSLWNAWQKDYGQVEQQKTVATTTTTEDQANTINPAVAPEAKTTVATTPTAQATQIPESRLIKVHTDILDVAIDTLGGDVIHTSLLKYPEIIYKEHATKLLTDDSSRYYTAQSGLISKIGPDFADKQGQYTSASREYTLQPGKNNLEVKLLWNNSSGLAVTKTFIFTKEKYDFAVSYEIDNKSQQPWVGQFYAQIKRKDFDSKSSMFSFNTYTGAAISSAETPYEKISFSKMDDISKEQQGFIHDSKGGWVAMQQRYFLSVWVPQQDKIYRYFSNVNNGIYTIGLSDDVVNVPAGQKATIAATLYTGPGVTENLAPLAAGLDRTVDYGWLWLIASAFFWILKKIYLVVGNWGWAIILITLLIKLVFYKLSESSCRSMARMRDLMPKMQALKERYGDDKQKLQQATMDLYKQEKINPMNLGGCLPMLIQIPFFIALYYVLMGAVELRHAPFIFWIHDLSAQDPYYVLPILMGLSMVLQQRLNPTSADPTQAKMMMLMPVIFTAFFLTFPSGLVLYWLMSNILSILQQWYINKKLAKPRHSKNIIYEHSHKE